MLSSRTAKIVAVSTAIVAAGAGVGYWLYRRQTLAAAEEPAAAEEAEGETTPSIQEKDEEDATVDEQPEVEEAAPEDPETIENEEEVVQITEASLESMEREAKAEEAKQQAALTMRIQQIQQHIKQVSEQGDTFAQAELTYLLAVSFLGKGNIEEAMKYYKDALQLSQDSEHKGMESACLADLGSLSLQTGEYNNSISYFEKGLQTGKEFAKPEAEKQCKICLAFAYSGAGRHADAIPLFEAVIAKSRKDNGNEVKEEIAALLQSLGAEYLKNDQPRKALTQLEEAIDTIEEITGSSGGEATADSLFYVARASFSLGDFATARKHFQYLLPIMEEADGDVAKVTAISQLQLLSQLSVACAFTGDADAAARFAARADAQCTDEAVQAIIDNARHEHQDVDASAGMPRLNALVGEQEVKETATETKTLVALARARVQATDDPNPVKFIRDYLREHKETLPKEGKRLLKKFAASIEE